MTKPAKHNLNRRTKTPDGVEIRYNEDGTVDEIIIYAKELDSRWGTRKVLLHLEQMSDASYWIGLPGYSDSPYDDEVHVDMFTDGTMEDVEMSEDGKTPECQRIFARVRT